MRRDYIKKYRIHITGAVFLLITMALLVRLFFIQILGYDMFQELAVAQREVPGITRGQRGYIYDRNMIPLTYRQDEILVLIEPNKVKDADRLLALLYENSSETKEKLKEKLEHGDLFSVNVSRADVFQDISGICTVSIPKRYGNNDAFSHVVGYADADNAGMSGIEREMDGVLRGHTKKQVVKIADSKSNQIEGLGFKITGLDEAINGVKLTLDYRIQKAVFDATDSMKKGAAVVVDVQTGDVLALVSRPNYDQNQVSNFIASKDGALLNRAFLEYNAGSVFKIAVASAAIEQAPQILKKTFYCEGYILVKGRRVACNKREGHGYETFAEAFAHSCNPAFIETGETIGKASIIEMAQRFGFGAKTGILPGGDEKSGVISKVENNYPLDCANLSLGQGDLMVTPLQVASMVTTVASGGIKKQMNLLDSEVDADGNFIKSLKQAGEQRIISEAVADKVAGMMRLCVTDGTGTLAESELFSGAAGKTGSAQTGWVVDGQALVHGWFAGFFPYQQPKYAVVVFVEGGESGSAAAAPIFQKIVDGIAGLTPAQ